MKSTNIYLNYKNQRAKARAGFSSRLAKVLIERGKCCARAAQIADPKFLAQLVDCSVVMARRYLLGQSIPTEPNLKKISEWAGVTSSWLLFGDIEDLTNKHNFIDKKILTIILVRMRAYLFEKTLTDEELENYISFAVDIYQNIYHLNLDLDDKVKMIELMIKSINFTKDKKNVANIFI